MSKIQWTQETVNPFVGCSKVSPGCRNCYAEKMAMRLCAMGQEKYFPVVTPNGWTGKTNFNPSTLEKIFQWRKHRMIFMVSMGDLFHDYNDNDDIARVFAAMYLNPQHTFQLLTKRPERAAIILKSEDFWFSYHKYCNSLHDDFMKPLEQELYFYDEIKNEWPLKNVWFGVTAENQDMANERIPILVTIPTTKNFVSCEPLLSSINFEEIPTTRINGRDKNNLFTLNKINHLDWVIVGCESGSKRRPMEEHWALNIKNQCVASGVPFFFKQKYIGTKKISMPILDGKIWDQLPITK